MMGLPFACILFHHGGERLKQYWLPWTSIVKPGLTRLVRVVTLLLVCVTDFWLSAMC